MKVSHIEHLGIAVKSLDEAIPYWEGVLGLKCYAIEEVADQKVRTLSSCWARPRSSCWSPLPRNRPSPSTSRTAAWAFTTWLSPARTSRSSWPMRRHGNPLIDKTPRKGAEGMTIAFLHPKSTQGILTELCENKNK